ncbi:MAG: amino acid permease [Phycisphaerales bacterium]|nr:amino acid permease [Phycisphaerales bacterium]
MLVTDSRPRNLKWFHAGPLLYGDWGTSRLYVLGLAFFFTGHASVVFLGAIGLLMAAVAWAYTIICRCFPEGGGVYSAARQLSPVWSVIGATLLIGGYIMTAAISIVEAFHYFGVPHSFIWALSALSIVLLGAVNWLGARSAGRLALLIALIAVLVSLVIAVLCIPYFMRGLKAISWTGMGTPAEAWVHFTRICLAMSGVEAVANMTGLMRQPVERTARRTIWPVLIEVVALNMIFGIAIAGLPQALGIHESPVAHYAGQDLPADVVAFRDTAMRELAAASGESAFGPAGRSAVGIAASIVFGLLLLSAGNTAIMALVSVLYSMGHDREVPKVFTKLNYSGVPWAGLVFACAAPIVTIAVTQDVAILAELYVLGVFGAVTTSVMAVALNRSLEISGRQRNLLFALGGLLSLLSITVVVTSPRATIFAGGLVLTALIVRSRGQRKHRAAVPPLPTPAAGWLSELQAQPLKLDPSRPRIMLASRGRYQSEFAVDLARRRRATLFGIYVRTLRVMDINPKALPKLADDPVAQEALGTTALLAREAGVPFVPVYVTSEDISAEILDYTVTFGCDTLIMGKSRRSLVSRRVQGDVVARVAENLPDEVALITRSADQPHLSPAPAGSTGADPETSSNDPIGHA